MKTMITVLLLATSCFAETKAHKIWRWSVAAVVAGSAADAATSLGKHEGNPVLGASFGGRALAIKGAVLGTSLGVQYFAMRHGNNAKTIGTIANFSAAGVFAATAIHNSRIK